MRAAAPWVVLAVLVILAGAGVPVAPATSASSTVFIEPPRDAMEVRLREEGPVHRFVGADVLFVGRIATHDSIVVASSAIAEQEDRLHLHASGRVLGRAVVVATSPEGVISTQAGHARVGGQGRHVDAELPESILWGRALSPGASWSPPVRHAGDWTHAVTVTVGALAGGTLSVTVREVATHAPSGFTSDLEATLAFSVVEGRAGPFAATRAIRDGDHAWSGIAEVVSAGGAPLAFGAAWDDAWPATDPRFPHGAPDARPYDPLPHALFAPGRAADVALALPLDDVVAFRAGGAFSRTDHARFVVDSTRPTPILGSDVPHGAAPAVAVGTWDLALCNDAGDMLRVTMTGVQAAAAPFAPALVDAARLPGACSAEGKSPHAGLGAIVRALELTAALPPWQPVEWTFTGGGAPSLVARYADPRVDDGLRIEVDARQPVVLNTWSPRA